MEFIELLKESISEKLILLVAALFSAISAFLSARSARISKEVFEFSQTPILTISYNIPVFYVRNIGENIGKITNWLSNDIKIISEIKNISDNIIFPIKESFNRSNESESPQIAIEFEKGKNYNANIYLFYEDLKGNIYCSQIICSKSKNDIQIRTKLEKVFKLNTIFQKVSFHFFK